MAVILLDGFDELLQAAGVSHTDYLERVARFQQREADQGRPVAIVVTSRMAVAGHARIPAGTPVIRLEPFGPDQVRRWLSVWNAANVAGLQRRGLAPLTTEQVLEHRDLAMQPLLLLMLVLYDSDANALQRHEQSLGKAQLYERLLWTFAEREVRKLHGGSPEQTIRELVEAELARLSVTAFAAFNRGRQWVTAADLDADLTALLGDAGPAGAADRRAPLGPGDRVLGRFFFVQRAEALRDGRRLTTYEFLHATFGEYLVARLTMHAARDLARQEAAAANSVLGGGRGQDGLLYALLSFASLTARDSILRFVAELTSDSERDDVRALPGALLRRIDARNDARFADYAPARLPAPSRYARYSLNLVLLAAALHRQGGILVSDLFGGLDGLVESWRRHALLWASALPAEEWRSLLFSLRVVRVRTGGQPDLMVTIGRADPGPVDLGWQLDHTQPVPPDELRLQANLLCDRGNDPAFHALDPLLSRMGPGLTSVIRQLDRPATTIGALLLELWSAEPEQEGLTDRHAFLVAALVDTWLRQPEARFDALMTRELELLERHATMLDRRTLTTLLNALFRNPALLTRVPLRLGLRAAVANLARAPFDRDDPLLGLAFTLASRVPREDVQPSERLEPLLEDLYQSTLGDVRLPRFSS
ncbi:hypothetical protein [Dactylosporangium salmoneum]|uniref:NACHT domain-containing protein n=1 Tax=Dactylosporangium salmoneum TaxID=53361 RepID=A0ABP5TZQ9_9ACTN